MSSLVEATSGALALTFCASYSLEEGGIVTRCEITTYEPEGLLDLAFVDEDKVQRLIIKVSFVLTHVCSEGRDARGVLTLTGFPACTKSDWLRDALLEVPSSSEKLSISFSPSDANEDRYRRRDQARRSGKRRNMGGAGGREAEDEAEPYDDDEEEVPLFRLESVGPMGSTEVSRVAVLVSILASIRPAVDRSSLFRINSQMDYSDDKDVLEIFECEQALRNS